MFRYLAFFSLFLNIGFGYEHQDLSTSKNQKIYISPSHVHIAKEGILIQIQNHWIQTSSLHTDQEGLYVETDQFTGWVCGVCGRWTTGWWVCEHCGNPK